MKVSKAKGFFHAADFLQFTNRFDKFHGVCILLIIWDKTPIGFRFNQSNITTMIIYAMLYSDCK